MSKSSVPKGDHPSRHSLSHHSDSSGAHVRGTHHHEQHAHNPKDGLTTAEGGEGHADEHISTHTSSLDLPAMSHNAGKQE
jgi:hypothetical protein